MLIKHSVFFLRPPTKDMYPWASNVYIAGLCSKYPCVHKYLPSEHKAQLIALLCWTPLIDASKLRGEPNVSIERMASIRTMVLRTILKQCLSQTERAKLFLQ